MRTQHTIVIPLLILLSGFADDLAGAEENDWKAVEVPQVWKNAAGTLYRDGGGYAWFRCWVMVPESWAQRELELFCEPVDDAREIFVNGRRVGGAGSFPPEYRSGLGGPESFPVSAGSIRPGDYNLIAIRVHERAARANFNVAAPALFGGEEAIRLRGPWQARSGDDAGWSSWEAPGEDDAAFRHGKVEAASTLRLTLKKLEGEIGPLEALESLRHFALPEDLVIELVLAEPHVRQPLSIEFDERGRLWVVEYLQYPDPAGLKMISRDKYLRTVYDRVPPPPPHHFRGADRLSIHEDRDGDGSFEHHAVFVDGLNMLTSAARGRGGVWVLNPPYLLFYADRDGDDRPDGDPEVHLEGFGLEDSHSITNSLRWGPDGWLYAAQGSTVSAKVRRPGQEGEAVHSIGQLIWRYRPETRTYEIFAEGGGNAFGLEIDSKGRVYSGHNGGDTRGFHYVQGGYYRKGFEKHGSLSNPYSFGYFPPMAHHRVARFTHTFVIYEGGALPGAYDGKLFAPAPLQSHVVYSEVQRDRSSFKTRDLGHAFETKDSWVRPVDIRVGPDGAIYVADFYEQRIDHASHYQGRIHRESGRIYRIRARDGERRTEALDLGRASGERLLELLSHENRWFRSTARRVLADRRDTRLVPALEAMLGNNDGQTALEALWALNLTAGLDDETASSLLGHRDPHVRLWTARLLGDRRDVGDRHAAQLAALARTEPEVEVRSQLASTVRRLPASRAMPILHALLGRDEDVYDIHIPLLLWWAVEEKLREAPERVLELFREASLWERPLVREHLIERLARRQGAAGSRADLEVLAELFRLAPEARHGKGLLAGFEKAFEGRTLSALPDELVSAMARFGGASLALRLRAAGPDGGTGDGDPLTEALKRIADEDADETERRRLVQVLGEVRRERCVPELLRLVEKSGSESLRVASLRALQIYDQPEIATRITEMQGDLLAPARDAAMSLLASRPGWSRVLVRAVKAGRVEAASVPNTSVRKMLLHEDEELAAGVREIWGPAGKLEPAELRSRIRRHEALLTTGSGDPYRGKGLYRASCGKCHVLFDEGGNIGPSLTSYQRNDLQSLLLNVVDPGAEIREGYENYVVVTADGRALTGFLSDRDEKVLVLTDAEGQATPLPRSSILRLQATETSLMPEGLLESFTDQDVRDLFAYLRASQPLP